MIMIVIGPSMALAASGGSTHTMEGTSCYTGQSAFEPSLGITSNGTIFMESAVVVQRGVLLINEIQRVVRSWGECDNWKDVTLSLDLSVEQQSLPPQSNDPMVHVDPDTDRVFNLDMQGLSCNWLSFSDDFGETWTANPVACGQPPVLDHPTIFTGPPRLAEDKEVLDLAGYPNVVYLCVNRVADSACARSLNGGLSFGPFFPLVFGGTCIGAGLHHFGVTDSTGRAFLGQVNACTGSPQVAISTNDGITWRLVTIASGPGVQAQGHDVDIAVDDNDNVYASWISDIDDRPRLSVSTDHGSTWSTPIDVAPSDLESTSFISMDAGSEGRIAFGYLGSQAARVGGEVPAGEPWGAYITISTDALSTTPSFQTVAVNASGDPVARGPCNDSNRCEPPEFGGSPGDFQDIVIDPDGRPWAAFVDVCTGPCVTGTQKSGQDAFAGTLEKGPRLQGPGNGALPPLK